MHCAVTGGTGFVGQHLIRCLERPVVLGRDRNKINTMFDNVIACQLDTGRQLDLQVFKGVDTVFHLAGESVFKGRWNDARKKRILESRVTGTRSIVQALGTLDQPPATLVCASAIGYYGARGDEILHESSAPGNDFLAQVCQAWEAEARKAEDYGIRVVTVRIGIVLGSDGGALAQMLLPFKLGIGGRIGSGEQYMSWIHIDDLTGILLFVADHPEINGAVNAVSPSPLTNTDFTTALAAQLRRPALLNVPAAVLKITMGEFAEVLLGSQRVMPSAISKAGYTFFYPELKNALKNLLS